MTFTPGQMGAGRPPLENAASSVLAAARGRIGGQRPYPALPPQKLTAEQQQEAIQTISNGGGCGLCGGIHAAAEHGCPRLASFRLDGDGRITEGTFWPDGSWDRSSVVFATDEAEEGTDGTHPA